MIPSTAPDEVSELERKVRADLEDGHWITEVATDHGVSAVAVRGLLQDAAAKLCRKCRGKGSDEGGHSCGPCKGDGFTA